MRWWVCSVPGRVTTIASTSATAASSSSIGTSRSTPSTGSPFRVVPHTWAPSALKRRAHSAPMPPSPPRARSVSSTWRISHRSTHRRSSGRRASRGRSFAPAMTPNTANSASGPPWTPALVVKTTRSSASRSSPAAFTWPPPPAAVVMHPAESWIRGDRSGQGRRLDVGDAEERLGRVDHAVELRLLLRRRGRGRDRRTSPRVRASGAPAGWSRTSSTRGSRLSMSRQCSSASGTATTARSVWVDRSSVPPGSVALRRHEAHRRDQRVIARYCSTCWILGCYMYESAGDSRHVHHTDPRATMSSAFSASAPWAPRWRAGCSRHAGASSCTRAAARHRARGAGWSSRRPARARRARGRGPRHAPRPAAARGPARRPRRPARERAATCCS